MRRFVSWLVLLTGMLQFTGCGVEFVNQSRATEQSSVSARSDAAEVAALDGCTAKSGVNKHATHSENICHLFCSSHCAQHHDVGMIEITFLLDAPAKSVPYYSSVRVNLAQRSPVFEPPRI